MPAKCYLWVFFMWMWLGGTLLWYEAVCYVCWVWVFLRGTLVQNKSATAFALPRSELQGDLRWILLGFDFEMPRRG